MRISSTIVAVALLAGCAPGPGDTSEEALAGSPPAAANADYLALGDSIAFGFNPNVPYAPPFDKFVGYPEATASSAGRVLANASCPGETSASFLDATQPDNGCHTKDDYFAKGLHVDYQGAASQIDYALAFLASHPGTRLITVNIGANDLLLAQDACAGSLLCIAEQLPLTIVRVTINLTTIFTKLRLAGYTGTIVALTQYATNYRDPQQLAALTSLKETTEKVTALFGGKVADGFGAFAWASLGSLGDPCAAGLLLVNPDGTCDKHPSDKGRQVLADAVLSAL
jgi:lysophospholipase L1-like esterase